MLLVKYFGFPSFFQEFLPVLVKPLSNNTLLYKEFYMGVQNFTWVDGSSSELSDTVYFLK